MEKFRHLCHFMPVWAWCTTTWRSTLGSTYLSEALGSQYRDAVSRPLPSQTNVFEGHSNSIIAP